MIQELLLKTLFALFWFFAILFIINLLNINFSQRLFLFKGRSPLLSRMISSFYKSSKKYSPEGLFLGINSGQFILISTYVALVCSGVLSVPSVEYMGSVFPKFAPDRIYFPVFLITISLFIRSLIFYSSGRKKDGVIALSLFKNECAFIVIVWICMLAAGISYGASSYERIIKIQQGEYSGHLPNWGILQQPLGAIGMFSLLIMKSGNLTDYIPPSVYNEMSSLPYRSNYMVKLADKLLFVILIIIFMNIYLGAGTIPGIIFDSSLYTGFTGLFLNIIIFSIKLFIIFFLVTSLGFLLKKRGKNGETRLVWSRITTIMLANLVYVFYLLLKKDFGA